MTPEAPLPLLLADNLENPYQPNWDYAAPVTAFVDGGFLIRFTSNWAIRPRLPELTDAEIDVQVRLTNGTVMLFTHVSSVGAYRLTLTAQGQATLYRGATVVTTTSVSVPQSTWFTLRFSVMSGVLQAYLNGIEFISYSDATPLPPGRVLLGARDLNGGNVQMDNVTLYGNAIVAPASFEGQAMAVAPASGGGDPQPPTTVIVFSANNDIYRINPDGTGRQNITNNGLGNADPTLSPDGQQVAFVSSRNSNLDIFVMNIDGSNQRPLTNHPEADYQPAWSPLGDRIAFQSTRDGSSRIYHMSSTQGDQTALTSVIADANNPAWSPDGSQLAISLRNPQTQSIDIYTIGKNGGTPTYRGGYAYDAYDDMPTWAPDGGRIVFNSFYSVEEVFAVVTFSSTLVRIEPGNGTAANALAALEDAGAPNYGLSSGEVVFDRNDGLYIISAAGGQPVRINNTSGNDKFPDWGIAAPLPATPTPTVLVRTPAPTLQPTVTPTAGPLPTPTTELSFDGEDAYLKALMFWALYFETSSDRYISSQNISNPAISGFAFTTFLAAPPYCVPGVLPGDNAESNEVFNLPSDYLPGDYYSYIRHCPYDHRYMMAQAMINAFLRYERVGFEPFAYVFQNFSETFTRTENSIWTINDPICTNNEFGVSYTFALVDGLLNGSRWLASYLACLNGLQAQASQPELARIQRAYRVTIYPQITRAIADFYTPPPAAAYQGFENTDDPTHGAVQVKDANNNGAVYTSCVGGCQRVIGGVIQPTILYTLERQPGLQLAYITAPTAITLQDITQAYALHIQQLANYQPSFGTVLQPVLNVDFSTTGEILGYSWISKVYQRSANLEHVPRALP
ncbi:MAG: hypothetical protein SF123_25925 [Chloroflexota bacterium]|nr:hypothetical protein [Chloroflexota bacterium]